MLRPGTQSILWDTGTLTALAMVVLLLAPRPRLEADGGPLVSGTEQGPRS